MSTEYRRGIPSVAHVEAATRLGLLWGATYEGIPSSYIWRFVVQHNEILSVYHDRTSQICEEERNYAYRPIRTDGTPVDWEVLDAEVARAVQPATVTPTTPATPTTQPRGFRADLWRRICEHFQLFWTRSLSEVIAIDVGGDIILSGSQPWSWNGAPGTNQSRTDILTRWAIYQELKPLYDLVDGAQGEVAMPRDVELAWAYCVAPSAPFAEGWFLFRDESGLRARLSWWGLSWRPEEDEYGTPLRNFAAVLDAVAEQRVAARQGQAQPNTVTLSVGPSNSFQYEAITASPEPRSFADVRPDRHGWRWWRIVSAQQRAIGARSARQPTQPTPLPRFTADELDDVDHSATTTQDSAALKRGKLPTVEAISKYREVMAKRNGTVAEAVKASGIVCEVAQYVLERWAGGLNDTDVRSLLGAVGCMTPLEGAIPSQLRVFDPTKNRVDELAQHWLKSRRPTLDTSEPADTAAQRQRAEAAERKTRMTALQAQLAKERAARVSEPEPELSRFALLEVDEAADPARSIEAWKAQRARNTVRPIAVPASQPTPAPRRKAFEVIDAQAEGLSGTVALAVLLGRAMNGGC